jgi:hypothetical protein
MNTNDLLTTDLDTFLDIEMKAKLGDAKAREALEGMPLNFVASMHEFTKTLDGMFTVDAQDNMIVYRALKQAPDIFKHASNNGIPWKMLLGLKDRFFMGRYLSATFSKKICLEYVGENNKDYILFRLFIPKGTKRGIPLCILFPSDQNEYEWLIKRETMFEIIAANEQERMVDLLLHDE